MSNILIIETKRTSLEILSPKDAKLMVNYLLANKAHLSSWEPIRESSYYTEDHWSKFLDETTNDFYSGLGYKFAALDKNRSEIIGICNFNNIVKGAFQASQLGYSVSEQYQSQGYMFEILGAAIEYIFNTVGLHRIMANYIPTNQRSEQLLKRLGFEREGLAKSYLKIAGKWQDHVLTSKLNPNTIT